MPKVKPPQMEEKNRIVRSIIAKHKELEGLKDKDIAKRLPGTIQTFQNKFKRPETFTLWELRLVCDILKIPVEERGLML